MENQHRHIAGYRELDTGEIELINKLKGHEQEVASLVTQLDDAARALGDSAAGRWASIARTHFETGFMYAIKAVARPEGGMGRK